MCTNFSLGSTTCVQMSFQSWESFPVICVVQGYLALRKATTQLSLSFVFGVPTFPTLLGDWGPIQWKAVAFKTSSQQDSSYQALLPKVISPFFLLGDSNDEWAACKLLFPKSDLSVLLPPASPCQLRCLNMTSCSYGIPWNIQSAGFSIDIAPLPSCSVQENTDWNVKHLFGIGLAGACPVADNSQVLSNNDMFPF